MRYFCSWIAIAGIPPEHKDCESNVFQRGGGDDIVAAALPEERSGGRAGGGQVEERSQGLRCQPTPILILQVQGDPSAW